MLRGVIFDLDGVLFHTDEYHYDSWFRVAKEYGVPFTRSVYDASMRGLRRSEALKIFLAAMPKSFSADNGAEIADKKNAYFQKMIANRPPRAVDGARSLLRELRVLGIKLAVGSSSRNALLILRMTGLLKLFDALVDGDQVAGKPNPEVFRRAAALMHVRATECVVIEDAKDGVRAARNANMAVIAIGPVMRFDVPVPLVRRFDEITVEMLRAELKRFRKLADTAGASSRMPGCQQNSALSGRPASQA